MDYLGWIGPDVVLARLGLLNFQQPKEAAQAFTAFIDEHPKFCSSLEGWGPVSPQRTFDFTPCFEYGVIFPSCVALLVIFGVPRIWQLVKGTHEEEPYETRRGRKSQLLLFTKIAALFFSLAASLASLILVVIRSPIPGTDQETYSTIFDIFGLSTAIPLTYLNHVYTRRSSTILLTFYPLYLIASLIALRTSLSFLRHEDSLATAHFALLLSKTFLITVTWILECLGSEVDDVIEDFVDIKESIKESPYETANVYSRLAFTWMTPLMRLGYQRYVVQEDLSDLAPGDASEDLGNKLQRHWDTEMFSKKSPSLWRALGKAYGGPFAVAAGLKVLTDILQFAQPQFLRYLLAFISDYQKNPEEISVIRGFAICGFMFLSALAQSAILHQYFQLCFVTGSRVRAGLVMTIYRKSLVLSNDENTVRGDIVNLMSVDASRMQELCTYALIALSGPFQIVLAFISLYSLLGWSSFVGVGVMVLSVPINTALAKYIKTLQEKQMKNRDGRTRMMSELLNNIKSIKLYAWEQTFIKKILSLRNDKELRMLKKIGVTAAFNTVFWSMVPYLVAFSSFATAAYTNEEPLTSEVIFPAISLFMLLQFPLGMFAMITSSIISAMVSVERLSKFLRSPELQPDARTILPPSPLSSANTLASSSTSSSAVSANAPSRGETVLSIRSGEFRWSKDAVESTLEDINVDVKMGELLGVFGRVGSGKSSLLSAIIGEMTRSEGALEVFGSVAYAPQNPWIMSTTVRDNIVFFRHFDSDFYEMVLDACALRPDLALLPEGDMTEVGEKGITLSGGQRARISLARCVYARADLYLLDDVLAAVDAHVARHLFDRVIGPRGLLSRKARLVVTNSVASVREYDRIILLRRGIILERGSYDEIMSKPDSELCKLITEYSSKSASSSSPTSGSTTPVTPGDTSTLAGSIDRLSNGSPSTEATLREKLQLLVEEPPSILSRKEQKDAYDFTLTQKSSMFLKEASEQGQVKFKVYLQYMQAASRVGVFLFLLSIFGQQAFTILSNLTLRAWGESNLSAGENEQTFYYLMRYGFYILAACLSSFVAGISLWVYCAVRSAQRLHDSMLVAVLRAPLGWFERTPQGRILNLFSKDVNVLDEVLVRVFSSFFRTMANCLGILVVMGAAVPVSLVAVVPLGIMYQRFMSYYLATSRELKRLDAVSRSPIFAWFQESLGGLSTIRAFQLQPLFVHTNEMRSDTNLKAYLPSTYVNRWLALRLELLGACIVLVVGVLSVWTLVASGEIDGGLVGLVLSYAVNTTGSLNWVIRSASDVEQNIVSVERILTYVDVEPEAPAEIPETKPAPEWPPSGAITLENYSMRYREGLDLVLRSVNIQVKPGESLGICGRTGAGKSSLILGLLRINEAAEGRILIDGVDISKIGLHDLRSAISIIPQEPQLFAGTIRQNVDVTETCTDEAIWHALDQVHLKQTVSALGGLDAPVREGGSSLSSGQRQLVCFARALIRHSKILILDEATSAIDLESDQAIQDVLRGSQFHGVTRLTIAHRLHTIIESDRILVLDAGKVAELDSPQALLAKQDSIFASLASEAGIS